MAPSELDEKTEDKILNAAYDVFLNKGKSGTRMQEIADTAGVNKALLHYYYRSKDLIYKAVFKRVFKDFFKDFLSEIDFSLPFKDLLSRFISNHIKAVGSRQSLARFFFSEAWMNPDEFMSIFREYLNLSGEPLFSVFIKRFHQAVEDKEIRQTDPVSFLLNVIILDVFYFIASPIFFTLIGLPGKERKRITEQRPEEVFIFVWESIRYKGE